MHFPAPSLCFLPAYTNHITQPDYRITWSATFLSVFGVLHPLMVYYTIVIVLSTCYNAIIRSDEDEQTWNHS